MIVTIQIDTSQAESVQAARAEVMELLGVKINQPAPSYPPAEKKSAVTTHGDQPGDTATALSKKSTEEVITDPGGVPSANPETGRRPEETTEQFPDSMKRKDVLAALEETDLEYNKSANTKSLIKKLRKYYEEVPEPDAPEDPSDEKQLAEEPEDDGIDVSGKTDLDVRAELQKLLARCGRESAAAVLHIAGQGAAKASDLGKDHYPAFFALTRDVHKQIDASVAAGKSEADATDAVIKQLKKGWK